MANYQNHSAAPRKPVINRWEGIGIARPRSGNDGDSIKFFPFSNGGGAIHFTLTCQEIAGADQNGNPRTRTAYVPVNVTTNKNITEQHLRSIIPGMKLHIIGALTAESYDSKKSGQRVTTLVVNAFVVEVLEMPMQMPQAQPQYPGMYPQAAPQVPYQGQMPQYPQPAPQAYPGMYPQQAPPAGYAQPQAPVYPQAGYPRPQQAPAPAPAPAQSPYQGYQGQAPQQQPAQAPVPPFYQPGPAKPQAPQAPADEDMPEGMTV